MESEDGSINLKLVCFLALSICVGFTLNLLACILWHNWLPIIVVITYVLAPLPNFIFGRCQTDAFEQTSTWKDLGFFLTGALVVSGFALPAVLAHSHIIANNALIMAIAGGVIVYGTLLFYIHKFHPEEQNSF
eukprot:TRINITY_DN1370_c0_g1_i1.p1 TRINITY_DN1370_c0_g1~~TRINITY_DN1370_c0_g1_i1.p1  ORF type:complete len:133 (-),score=41.17 TRINITY_DN1370_c0_g1_i1:78-476(-)